MKKAQSSTEYLIVLAVVIVIALVVVGVLGGFPALNNQAEERSSIGYWQTSDIAITQVSDSARQLTLRNNLQNTVNLGTVEVGGLALSCDPTTLAAGLTADCAAGTIAASCVTGNAFSYDVSIAYTVQETGAAYTFTGDGNKLSGTCAD